MIWKHQRIGVAQIQYVIEKLQDTERQKLLPEVLQICAQMVRLYKTEVSNWYKSNPQQIQRPPPSAKVLDLISTSPQSQGTATHPLGLTLQERRFLRMGMTILQHTSYPWDQNTTNKGINQLVKGVYSAFLMYEDRSQVLAAPYVWDLRMEMGKILIEASGAMSYQWWDGYMEEVEVDLQMAANPDGRPEYLSIGSHIAMGIKRNEKQKSHEEAFRKIADIIQA